MAIGNATYWIVMFQVDPVPSGSPGPIKLNVKRQQYEIAMQDANATIDCSKGKFKITGNKRAFQMDDGIDIFLITDVIKVKQ